MTNYKKITFVFLFLILLANINYAEGWTKKAGKGFYAFDLRFLSATKFHDSNGKNVSIPKVNDLALNFFAEHGLTDDLSIRLNFPFYKVLESENSSSESINNSGVGDIDIGFRYKLGKIGSTVFATSISFGVPISSDDIYGKNKLPLSDGEFNQIIGIEFGHSLYPAPMYLSGSLKYNNRNEGYSDQFYAGFEGGYKLTDKLLMNVRFNFIKSIKNGDKIVDANIIPIQSNNQEYLETKIGVLYNFYKNIGVAAAANFGLYAKNILSAPVFSVGIYIK